MRFGETNVLTNLTFSVSEGSSLAIIGPNGAGKSVLLRSLLGSIPFDGTVEWAPGTRVGYVPQKLDIERGLPLTGNDLLRARLALAPESDVSIAHALDIVGLPSAAGDKLIGTFSGGQFQRLLIGFALLGKPTVLLLDEPTSGVDQPGQEQINALLHRLQHEQRLTILFISHDLSVVYSYSDDVLCLSRTKPCFGPPKQTLTPQVLEDLYGTPLRYHVHEP